MQENNLSGPGNVANGIDQAQFEADKRAVYKHPLFSLLALLLEKCEAATQGHMPSSTTSSPTSASPNGNSSNGNEPTDSFSRDIQAFVQLLEKEKRPLLTDNAELDGLMIKALQVLRIHLLELEKVQELCRDFCTRYIACLRGKMQSENLLRSDYALENNASMSNSNSPVNSPEQDTVNNPQQTGYYGNNEFSPAASGDCSNFSSLQGAYNIQNSGTPSETNFNGVVTDTIPGLSQTSLPITNMQQQALNSLNVLQQQQQQSQLLRSGGPLNQINCPQLTLDQYNSQLSPCGSSDDVDSELDSTNDEICSNFSNNSGGKNPKRGILPKQATSVMRAWLFQHLVHPYPTEDEKRVIAAQTNLTLLQVNNWFINARRRILQPMLEHATDNNSSRKKQCQSPSKRMWTNDVTDSNGNPSLIDPNIENISGNMNRADSAIGAQKLQPDAFYSSDESNESLVIDQEATV